MKTKINLLHISDIHWNIRNSGTERKNQDRNVNNLASSLLQRIRTGQDFFDHDAPENVIIFGGDIVGRGNWSYENQRSFRDFVFKNMFDEKGPKWTHFVSVPGNHDAEFGPSQEAFHHHEDKYSKRRCFNETNSGIRLRGYQKSCWLTKERTFRQLGLKEIQMINPFGIPDGRKYALCGDGRIYIRAFNSAGECGSPNTEAQSKLLSLKKTIKILKLSQVNTEGDLVDQIENEITSLQREADNLINLVKTPLNSAYVSPAEMTEVEEEIARVDPQLRIAVIHHNTLNYPMDDTEAYHFDNQTQFNSFLLRNRFQLVLHGHQHSGVVRYYSEQELAPTSSGSKFLNKENGFFSIGAPEFDLSSAILGYNAIRIELDEDDSVAEVSISKIEFNRSLQKFHEKECKLNVELEVFTPEVDEVMREVRRVVARSRPCEAIKRALDRPKFVPTYGDRLRETLDNDMCPIATYAVSVFGPQRWFGNKVLELQAPYFVNSFLHRAVRQSERSSDGIYKTKFPMTSDLYKAIGIAKENGVTLDVMSKLKGREYDGGLLGHEHLDFLARNNVDERKSLSLFAHGQAGHPRGKEMIELHIEDNGLGLPIEFVDADTRNRCEHVNESARILLWDQEDFLRPSAYDVILFHEWLQVPLFWIDPKRLVSRDENGTEFQRSPIGYFMYSSLSSETGASLTKIQEWAHTKIADPVDLRDFMRKAWKNCPPPTFSLNVREASPKDEFVALLQHQNLCFAVDAWFVANCRR